MWCNNIRVRHLAKRTLGHDLSNSIHGIDEKPIHFNEAPHRTPSRWGGGLVALRWFGEHCSVSVVCCHRVPRRRGRSGRLADVTHMFRFFRQSGTQKIRVFIIFG